MTIICGENNTGKTYATYALYGFFDFWKNGFLINIEDNKINELMEKGTLVIQLDYYKNNIDSILNDACLHYSKFLSRIFAANEKHFEDSSFSLSLSQGEILFLDAFNLSLGTPSNKMIQISKEKGKDEISVNLLTDAKIIDTTATRNNIKNAIGISLKEIIFNNIFPDVFIASAERTGIVIFKEELKEIEKNKLLKELASNPDIDDILNKNYDISYALPVKMNIDFINKLENIQKKESFLSKEHKDLLDDFSELIGGEYKAGKDGLYFIPNKSKSVKLTLGESSSSVRSLLDIGFYLRHVAEKGDILMVDEPELNLHPSNQRRLAKLFARLVLLGIKVFITTHSDYIIKELNTLIMLNNQKDSENIKLIMKTYGYKENELISPDKIKVYIACNNPTKREGKSKKSNIPTLKPAIIDSFYGIEAESFDKTINEMNEIQETIIIGK